MTLLSMDRGIDRFESNFQEATRLIAAAGKKRFVGSAQQLFVARSRITRQGRCEPR
jgi:hypothetical protein